MERKERWKSNNYSLCAAVMVAVIALVTYCNVTAEPLGEFLIFDATLYAKKPALTKYGIKPIRVIYGQEIWDDVKNMDPLPSYKKVRALARRAAINSSIVVLDVEHWPVRPRDGDVDVGLSKLTTLFRWFKDSAPKIQVGYYSLLPVGDYWRAIKPKENSEHKQWQTENDKVGALARTVDALFPSLYTYYDDQAGWVRFAEAQIAEARRIGRDRPIYVFLWPQFHNSTPIGLKYIDPEYWRLELEVAKAHADGIVIWGGWDFERNAPAAWDENAGWWRVTLEFLRENGLSAGQQAP